MFNSPENRKKERRILKKMNTKYISNKMRRVKKYKINHKLVKKIYICEEK